jgi:hypothetical protein
LRVRTATEDAAAAAAKPAPQRDTLQVDAGGTMQAQFVREGAGTWHASCAAPCASPIRGRCLPSASPIRCRRADRGPAAAGQRRCCQRRRQEARRRGVAEGARRIQEEGGRSDTPGTAAPFVFDASGGTGYVPDAISLRVDQLDLGPRRLSNVTAGLSRQGELWRASVGADQLEGYIEYRPPRRAYRRRRVYARLARLSLPKGEAERVESLLDSQPAAIPAVDVVADDFESARQASRRLEIEATNRPSPTATAHANGSSPSST